MNENAKTLTFVVAAALVVLAAVWIRPRPPQPAEEADARGQLVFDDFQPLEATSLEIVEFDDEQATVRPFKVAQAPGKDGILRWSIPSHDNYPADAENQLADAATSLMGLTILDKVADSPGDHAMYGVVEPDPNRLRAGATGVGTKVVLRDQEEKELVSLIIGKAVPDRENLRYVRRVGRNPVYIVEVRTDRLSTRFEDWIEEDLLQLNPWDIREVRVLDYSFDELSGQPNIRGQFALRYNDTGDPRWEMIEDRMIEDDGWVDRPLGDDEELATSKLDTMRNAFDDLQIVDVATKPEGLSTDLRDMGTFRTNQEAVMSLARRGFYLVPVGPDQYELLSSEGEIRIVMEDGVQYTLRFGNVATGTGGGRVIGEEALEDPDADLNRFIFVMAEFNPEIIEKPELEPLPGEQTDEQPEPAPDNQTADDEPDDAEPSADEQEPANDGEEPANDGAEPADDAGEPAEADEPEAAADAEEEADTAEPTDADAEADLQAERERIERENQRKLDEYERKLEEGKARVQELNDRFADWYYVISDEVYRQIHLSRDAMVQPKGTADEDDHGHDHPHPHGDWDMDDLESFRELKEAGPEGGP